MTSDINCAMALTLLFITIINILAVEKHAMETQHWLPHIFSVPFSSGKSCNGNPAGLPHVHSVTFSSGQSCNGTPNS